MRAAAAASFGPTAKLLRAEWRLLETLLPADEVVEAVGNGSNHRRPFGNMRTFAATAQRLLVIDAKRTGRSVLLDAPWSDVRDVMLKPGLAVVVTSTETLAFHAPTPVVDFAVMRELAGGPIAARETRAALHRALGNSGWLHGDTAGRVASELRPGEQLLELARYDGWTDALIAVTSQRLGLVPASKRRESEWIDVGDVDQIAAHDDVIVVVVGGQARDWSVAPSGQADLLAAAVATQGVPTSGADDDEYWRRPEVRNGENREGDEGGYYHWWDSAGGWPHPPGDELTARLASFADETARSIDAAGTVDRSWPGEVTLRPTDPYAVMVAWADSGRELRLELRLELRPGTLGVIVLPRTPSGAATVENAVRAVIAGQVTTVHGRRSFQSVLQLPGWHLALPKEKARGAQRPIWASPDGRVTYRPYGAALPDSA